MEKGCLGNAIRNARLKANITQEDLSEKLGISVTHLKHIESEHRLPSVPLLIKIMTVLGMSFDDVVMSNMLAGAKQSTLPVLILSMNKTGVTPDVNALATIMILIIVAAMILNNIIQGALHKRVK